MHCSLWSRTIAVLVTGALLAASLVFAQDAPQQQTRPRRASQTTPQSIAPAPSTPVAAGTTQLNAEPVLRIGLATDARSATISTSGQLLNATESNASPTPLNVARVRIEPRLLAPQPATPESATFRVEITGAATRVDAERASSEIRELTGQESAISYDAETSTWRIRVGSFGSSAEAEETRTLLEDAGFAFASVVSTQRTPSTASQLASNSRTNATAPPGASSSNGSISSARTVRPVARLSSPTRELVAYAAPGATRLLNSRAPVTFASADERNAPVRFNDKPYRGRLEVFTNQRGMLTVVNVIGLEDYVRGVVPNELSPGSYGAIEALKAQAVAARTYAIGNRNNFASQGFDLLPTTRSQVYGGLSTEHPLATRAVEETRGIIATYQGEPINALYTSTCGGRTENAENVFEGDTVPYLRGRECAPEGRAAFVPFTIKTSRDVADIREEQNVALARDAAVLAVHDFKIPSSRMTDAWLSSPASLAEIRNWLTSVARLTRQPMTVVPDDATRAAAFSTALATAVYGEGRADTLLDNADVEYLLSFRDAGEVPASNRADVALLLRDGHLSLYADATLRPREPMPRGRILQTMARILEARGHLQLQKGTTRPATGGALILRSNKNRDLPIVVSDDVYLFRAFGDNVPHAVRSLVLVGGEPVTFHVSARGEVDYLETRPAPNGAASDRFSPFTNWTKSLTLAEARARLSRRTGSIGSLTDLRIARRGSSRRVIDLELIGMKGTTHLRGGRIRSILGLREQLFVIDRQYDEAGRVTGFVFTGRGFGHGVGMCQVGAYGLARAGLTYDKILQSYYTNIEITKLY